VGRAVGLRVGMFVGDTVGLLVGLGLGIAVGAQVSKLVIVMLTSLPKSTQCPSQFENTICCHKTLSGIFVESASSSYAKTVPFEHASIHL